MIDFIYRIVKKQKIIIGITVFIVIIIGVICGMALAFSEGQQEEQKEIYESHTIYRDGWSYVVMVTRFQGFFIFHNSKGGVYVIEERNYSE